MTGFGLWLADVAMGFSQEMTVCCAAKSQKLPITFFRPVSTLDKSG